jgi:hypothetical protein
MSIERLSMLSRVRTVLVALATVATVALSLTAALPSSAQAATGAKPKVGQCHQLSARQLASYTDSKKPVSCSKRHNLQTVAVVTSSTSLAGLSDDELTDKAYGACLPAYRKAAGGATKVAMTAYMLNLFTPTAAQRQAGARWFRCDVSLQQGRRYAVPLTHRLKRKFARGHLTDAVRRCLTSQRVNTTCDKSHAYRVMKAFEMSGTTYPATDAQKLAPMNRHCPKGWDIAFPPSEFSWAYGNRVVVCFDKTRK